MTATFDRRSVEPSFPTTDVTALQKRRGALLDRMGSVSALLPAGTFVPRNYPANHYPFRASSHFLYLTGTALPGAYVLLSQGRSILFAEAPDRDDALWHGPRPSLEELRDQLGFDEVLPLGDLAPRCKDLSASLATLPAQDADTATRVSAVCGRPVAFGSGASLSDERDVGLADAMIDVRLVHDTAAQEQLRAAAAASSHAHIAGMAATTKATTEAEVWATMVGALRARGMEDAYGPIVTVHGEILHAHGHGGTFADGDLLLCDVGGESPEGWASDITRTWPTSGRFSPTQKAIYEIVLSANRNAIDKVRPGVRYREVHEVAKRTIVEGLVAVGILKGSVDGLLERGAANLFFPHGVGHLLGLDVHDLEDLGDRAGYAPGRTRSPRFGDRYLRLDRDLVPGMAVTIEPGFYQVPGILSDPELTDPLGADLDREMLSAFADVRGIRIEDDVLCTEAGPEVLSALCPKAVDDVEATILG